MIKEKILQFGPERSLVGILSEPPGTVKSAQNMTIVLLNSGLLHRVGPNRLYVEMARKFAAAGYFVFRFDFSGIGDSRPRRDGVAFDTSSLQETRLAMDLLEKDLGIGRFLLAGVCSGADVSFFTAREDSRVAAVAPVDLFTHFTRGYMLHSYRTRLLSARSWGNLLRGKSDIVQFLRKVSVDVAATTPDDSTEKTAPEYSPQTWLDGFHTLLERKIPQLLIYSNGSPAYYNFNKYFRPVLRSHLQSGPVQVVHFSHSDHGFTLSHHRQELIDTLRRWLCALR